ncbi:DUF2737 family protein [Enterobacter kobei]
MILGLLSIKRTKLNVRIPREEMLKKNSFPSVNENKFLTAWLNQRAKK